MDRSDICIGRCLESEGGFVNNPKDPGGPTNRGVTLATARMLKIDMDGDGDTDIDDIRALTPEEATKVYKFFYWNPAFCDYMPLGVDYFMVDTAINSGVERAAKILQASLPGLVIDGQIGPRTLAAVRGANDKNALIDRLCDNRITFLQNLHHKKTGERLWNTFGKGWLARVTKVRRLAHEDFAAGF